MATSKAEDTVQICLGLSRPNKCAFCGCKENLQIHRAVPDRWNEYIFCQDTDCSKKYSKYVYSNDTNLTNGVPFCYTSDEYGYKKRPKHLKKVKKTKKDKKNKSHLCLLWGNKWKSH